MRTKSRVDANQEEIIKALRGAYASVQPIHTVGAGVPDLLVGYRGKNFLFEIKDGNKYKSHQKLTPHQEKWHEEWRGQVVVVNSVRDALIQLVKLSKD